MSEIIDQTTTAGEIIGQITTAGEIIGQITTAGEIVGHITSSGAIVGQITGGIVQGVSLEMLSEHNHSHTTLTGLDNDDHPQYLNEERHSEVDHGMIVYTLPQATETVLGGVKAKAKTTESGEVAIDETTGKLYAPTGGGSYTLPQATGSTLGGVKVKAKTSETGEVAIDGTTGKLYAPESTYTLPQADATTLGGIKAKPKTSETGEVAIDGATGKLYAPSGGESYTLPQANETTLGGIKAKEKTSESSEVAIDSVTGKLYAPESTYTLPQATETTLGGVKAKAKTTEVGEIAIDPDGKLFSPALPPIFYSEGEYLTEDFEDLEFVAPYTTSTWSITTADKKTGLKSIVSSKTYGQNYEIRFNLDVGFNGTLSFWYKVNKEADGYSAYTFKLDGITLFESMPAVPWTYFECPIAAGQHELYVRGSDSGSWWSQVFIDDLSFPGSRQYFHGIEDHSKMPSIFDNPGKLLKASDDGSALEFVPQDTFIKTPTIEGTARQVLTTDGAGERFWQTNDPIKLFSESGMATEDFEDDILLDNISITGNYDFQPGLNSFRSLHYKQLTGGTFDTTITIDMPVSAEVSFYYKCAVFDQNDSWNELSLLVDDVTFATSRVDIPWTKYNVELSIGPHTITLRNYSYSAPYLSEWWLDDLVVPGVGLTGMTAVSANADKLLATSIDGTHVGFLSKSVFITAPTIEGTAGQVLTTNGEGGRSWQTIEPSSVTEIPMATETMLGGVKAKEKTTESSEVAIESATGKLFVPAPDEAANGIPAGGAVSQILSKVDGTNYNTEWVDNPSAFSVAVAGGYSGDEEDFETDLASIEGLAAAIAAIVGA